MFYEAAEIPPSLSLRSSSSPLLNYWSGALELARRIFRFPLHSLFRFSYSAPPYRISRQLTEYICMFSPTPCAGRACGLVCTSGLELRPHYFTHLEPPPKTPLPPPQLCPLLHAIDAAVENFLFFEIQSLNIAIHHHYFHHHYLSPSS